METNASSGTKPNCVKCGQPIEESSWLFVNGEGPMHYGCGMVTNKTDGLLNPTIPDGKGCCCLCSKYYICHPLFPSISGGTPP